MAGPGGREVGRVSIRTLPDTSKFASSLQKYLERTERRLRVDLPVSLNAKDVARTESELAHLSRKREVDLGVNQSILSSLGKSMSGLSRGGFGGLSRIQLMVGAVVASLPAVATAILALPSMLAAVVAPIAAIALGLEGIKNAAQVLVAPFQAMQGVISGVFEKGLTPVFENLVAIFPTLTAGFMGIANALVQIADVIVARLVSSGGLDQIAASFASISAALATLAPAMGPLTDSLLLLLVEGTAAFARFAPFLADMIVKFNQLVTLLSESGALSMAFDSLSIVIGSVIAVFGGLVLAGAYVFTSMGVLARLISTVFVGAWNAARSAFQTGVNTITSLARGLPGRVVAQLGGLPSKLWSLGSSAMSGLYNGLVYGAKAVLAKAGEIASSIASKIAGALKIKSPSRVMMGIGGHITEGLALGIAKGESDVARSMQGVANTIAVGADRSLMGGAASAEVSGSGVSPEVLANRKLAKLLAQGVRINGSGANQRLYFEGA